MEKILRILPEVYALRKSSRSILSTGNIIIKATQGMQHPTDFKCVEKANILLWPPSLLQIFEVT